MTALFEQAQATWREVFGTPVPLGGTAQMMRRGWDLPEMQEFARIAEHAVAAGTAIADGAERHAVQRWIIPDDHTLSAAEAGHRSAVAWTAFGAMSVADRLLDTELLNWSTALPWVRVHSSAPEDGEKQARALVTTPDGDVGADSPLAAWLAAARDDDLVGPLAYAAGFSPEETAVQVRESRVDQEGLRTLAALRGYRLPDGF